jgi:iron complex outermembrane recepter protein
VNVNLGSTDVDSPTASATGGTVNYRTRLPYEDFSVRASGTMGDQDYMRIYTSVDTGNLTDSGLRAFVAAEKLDYNWAYSAGKINKTQLNARVYQPLGDNGDFISLSGHYNENRNHFGGSIALNTIVNAAGDIIMSKDGRYLTASAPCLAATPVTGVADAATSCGNQFDRRFNPSNTGNVRMQSRFTLSDKLVLTIDPSIQFVKANGGSNGSGFERASPTGGYIGQIGNSYYFGAVDLNGDGDRLDTVRTYNPNHTETKRIGLTSSLRYNLNDSNTVRVSYTYDRARHRQTGEVGLLAQNGDALNVFPINEPLVDVNGNVVQRRDRLSYAILHQVSGEYRGEFMDEKLVVNLGLRAPFFTRDLTNNCFTTSASGNVNCLVTSATQNTGYATATANATHAAPQQRTYKYDKLLPNVGFTLRATDSVSVFGSYSMGLSVPQNDSLYNAFFYAPTADLGNPNPEKTDSFDLGLRFTNGRVQAQVSSWYTKYSDRLASSFDPDANTTIYRNLGKVTYWGIDGSVSVRPIDAVGLYVFGSWKDTDIKDDVQTGGTAFAATAGKQVSGTSHKSYGGTAEVNLGPISLGATAKYTGSRWVNDINTQKVPGYWLVNLNARVGLEWVGLNDKTFIQLNMYNATDEVYVGGFGGGLTSITPFVQIGAPRTFSATVNMQF